MQLDAMHAPLDFRVPNHIDWYSEGFRWIGSFFRGVTEPIEISREEEAISETRARLLSHF